MFERLVQNLVRRYLREYVNLDDSSFDSLVVSLWKGDMSINNVHLKLGPLQKLFGNGTEVKRAVVGSISIQIPWSSLQSQPVSICLEGIKVVACANVGAGVESSKARRLSERRERLVQLDAAYAADAEEAVTEEEAEEKKSFLEKLGEKILDNLQLVLKDVHMQYVDAATGVLGVTVDEVSLLSTDKDWNKAFIVGQETLRKLARIEGFSFYFNATKDERDQGLLLTSFAERNVLLQERLIQLKVAIHRNREKLKDAKYNIEVSFGDIDVCLARAQWLGLAQTMDRHTSNITLANALISSGPLRKPKRNVKDDPRAWWRWAILTILQARESSRKQRERLLWFNRVRSEYVLLYKHTLKATARTLPTLTDEQRVRLTRLEEDERFTMADIVSMRALAHEEVKRSHPGIEYDIRTPRNPQEVEEAPSSWTSRLGISEWWYGGAAKAGKEEEKDRGGSGDAEETVFQFNEEERDELLKTIGYKEHLAVQSAKRPSFPFKVRFQARISGCSISLIQDRKESKQSLALLTCTAIATQVAVSQEDRITLHFSATSLRIADMTSGARFADIVSHRPAENELQLFQVSYCQHTESSDSVVRLNHPLEVVYSKDFVDQAVEFFSIPKSNVQGIEISASDSISLYKEKYEGRVEEYLRSSAQRKKANVQVSLQAPIFVFPGAEPDSHLEVKLGTLHLCSSDEQGDWNCELSNVCVTVQSEDLLKDVGVVAKVTVLHEEKQTIGCVMKASPLRAEAELASLRRCMDILTYTLASNTAPATQTTDLTEAELLLLEVQQPLLDKPFRMVITTNIQLPEVSVSVKDDGELLLDASADSVSVSFLSSEGHVDAKVQASVIVTQVGKSHLKLAGIGQHPVAVRMSTVPDNGEDVPTGRQGLTEKDFVCPVISGSVSLENFIEVLHRTEMVPKASSSGSDDASALTRREVANTFYKRGIQVSDKRVNAIYAHFARDKQRFFFAMDAVHSPSGIVSGAHSPDKSASQAFQWSKAAFASVDIELVTNLRQFSLEMRSMQARNVEDYSPTGATRGSLIMDSISLTTRLAGEETVHVLRHIGKRRVVEIVSVTSNDEPASVTLQLRDLSVLLHPPFFTHTHDLISGMLGEGSAEQAGDKTSPQPAKATIGKVSVDQLTVHSITGEALRFSFSQDIDFALNPMQLSLPQVSVESDAGQVVLAQALEIEEGADAIDVTVNLVEFKVDPSLRNALQSMVFELPGGGGTKTLRIACKNIAGTWVDSDMLHEVNVAVTDVGFESSELETKVEVASCKMDDAQQSYLIADGTVPFVVYSTTDNMIRCQSIEFHVTPVSLPAILAAKADLTGLLSWVSGSSATEVELSSSAKPGEEAVGVSAELDAIRLTFPSSMGARLELEGFTYSSTTTLSVYTVQLASLRTDSSESALSLPLVVEADSEQNTYIIKSSAAIVEMRWTPEDLYYITTGLYSGLFADGPTFEPVEDDYVPQDLFVYVGPIQQASILLLTSDEECGELQIGDLGVTFKYMYSQKQTELQTSFTNALYETQLANGNTSTLVKLSDSPSFVYTQHWMGNQPVSYNFKCSSTEATWIAAAVQRLFVFVYGIFELMEAEKQRLYAAAHDQAQDKAEGKEVETPGGIEWTWSLDLASTKVCFPSNSGSGLLLTGAVVTHVTVSEDATFVRTVQLRLNQFTIVTCRLRPDFSVERAINSILIPSDVALTFVVTNTLSNLPLSRTIFVSLEDIDASWELQDTSTITEVLVATMRNRPSRKQLKYKLYQQALETEEAELKEAALRYEGYTGVTYDIRGALTKLSFRVFSAKTSLPFVELRVAETSTFEGSGKGGFRIQEQRVQSTIAINGISFNCFNAYINEWEPILETCSLGIQAKSNLNAEVSSAKASGTEICIENSTPIRFNIHPLHILTLASCYYETKAMRTVARELIDAASLKPRTTRPLLFLNNTGVDIWVGFAASRDPSDALLPTGRTLELEVPVHASTSRMDLPELQSLFCAIPSVTEPSELSLNNPGTQVVSLADLPTMKALWKVDNSERILKAQLTSLAHIRNNTDRALILAFASKEKPDASGHLSLDPNRSAFVPLSTMFGALLYIRLNTESEWRQVELAKLGEDVKRLLTLKLGDNEQSLLFTMKQQSPLDYHMRIIIEAPYKVWNLLTCPLYLTLRHNHTEQVEIPVGGFRYLYVYDYNAGVKSNQDVGQSQFCLSVIEGERSEWLPLAGKFRRKTYRMQHPSGRTLVHRLDNARRPREILVYTRFWIVNHTTVPLAYGSNPATNRQQADREVFQVETYENQRRYGKASLEDTVWTHKLLCTDRPAWSTRNGMEERTKQSLEIHGTGWLWCGEWEVDAGWEYGAEFGTGDWSDSLRETDAVRRRRWVRKRLRKMSDMFFSQDIHMQDDSTLCFKVDGLTAWSEAVDLSAAGTIKACTLERKQGTRPSYEEVVCSIEAPLHQADGLLQRTNICKIYHRLIIVNSITNDPKSLCFKQHDATGMLPQHLSAAHYEQPYAAVQWAKGQSSQLIVLQIGSMETSAWSCPINLHRLGSQPLSVLSDGEVRLFRVEVTRGGCDGAFVARIRREDVDLPLIKVENLSSDVLRVQQVGFSQPKEVNALSIRLQPNESAPFAWCCPAVQSPRLQVVFCDGSDVVVDVFDLSESKAVELQPFQSSQSHPEEDDVVRYSTNVVLRSGHQEKSRQLFWSAVRPQMHASSVLSRMDSQGDLASPWTPACVAGQITPIKLVSLDDIGDARAVRYGDILQLQAVVADGSKRLLTVSGLSNEEKAALTWEHVEVFSTAKKSVELSHFVVAGGVEGSPLAMQQPNVWLVCLVNPDLVVTVAPNGHLNLKLLEQAAAHTYAFTMEKLTSVSLPERKVFVSADVDGSMRVVRVSSNDVLDNVRVAEDGTKRDAQLVNTAEEISLSVKVDLSDCSLSLIDDTPEEVCLVWIDGEFSWKDTNFHTSLEAKLRGFRVDNQLTGAPFANVLRPAVLAKVTPNHAIHLSLVIRHHMSKFLFVHVSKSLKTTSIIKIYCSTLD